MAIGRRVVTGSRCQRMLKGPSDVATARKASCLAPCSGSTNNSRRPSVSLFEHEHQARQAHAGLFCSACS
jgi:hypothetical protein